MPYKTSQRLEVTAFALSDHMISPDVGPSIICHVFISFIRFMPRRKQVGSDRFVAIKESA